MRWGEGAAVPRKFPARPPRATGPRCSCGHRHRHESRKSAAPSTPMGHLEEIDGGSRLRSGGGWGVGGECSRRRIPALADAIDRSCRRRRQTTGVSSRTIKRMWLSGEAAAAGIGHAPRAESSRTPATWGLRDGRSARAARSAVGCETRHWKSHRRAINPIGYQLLGAFVGAVSPLMRFAAR